MLKFRAILAILGAAALVGLPGCGGDDSGESEEASTSKREIRPEAQQEAERLVLLPADFGAGWRASPPDQVDESTQDEFRRCVGLDGSELTIAGEADSDEYSTKNTTRASSSSTVFADAAGAETAISKLVESMDTGTAEDCMSDLIEKSGRQSSAGVSFGAVGIGELDFRMPPEIDEARGWQITIPLTIEGETGSPTIYLDVVALREGESLVTVEAQSLEQAFDPGFRDRLLGAVAGRMAGPAAAV